MKVVVQHNLQESEAKSRIQALIKKSKNDYSKSVSLISETWVDKRGTYSFITAGLKINGSVLIQSNQVAIDLILPFAAIIFQSKIKAQLIKEVTHCLI